MEPAVSRGDTPLKIDTTPQAIVASVGIVATACLVGFLVWSGWNGETIVGFGALAIGLFAANFATTRKAAQLDAKQDQQSAKLDTVVRQTDGELKSTITEAVSDGIARAVAANRQENERG
jgi:hypothetical protein